jgi:hypothetical protein
MIENDLKICSKIQIVNNINHTFSLFSDHIDSRISKQFSENNTASNACSDYCSAFSMYQEPKLM